MQRQRLQLVAAWRARCTCAFHPFVSGAAQGRRYRRLPRRRGGYCDLGFHDGGFHKENSTSQVTSLICNSISVLFGFRFCPSLIESSMTESTTSLTPRRVVWTMSRCRIPRRRVRRRIATYMYTPTHYRPRRHGVVHAAGALTIIPYTTFVSGAGHHGSNN